MKFMENRFFPYDHFNLEHTAVSRDFELTAIGFPHGLGTEGSFSPFTFRSYASSGFVMLMKATIADAIGLAGNSEEIDILERKIDALNKVMMDIINKSVAEGSSVEDHEDEFKDIHDQIEMLEHRIGALREATNTKEEREEKEKLLQKTIEDRAAHSQEYDDTIVRQMIECIKIYHDGRIEVIFGGGISIVEELK